MCAGMKVLATGSFFLGPELSPRVIAGWPHWSEACGMSLATSVKLAATQAQSPPGLYLKENVLDT
jgi:hypothetical protein